MRANEFEIYKLYRSTPPTSRYNGTSSAYFNGLNGIRCRYVAGSLAWAAWHAGADQRDSLTDED